MFSLDGARAALEAAGLVQGLPVTEIHTRLETGLRLHDTGQRVLAFYLNEMDVGRLYQSSGHASITQYAEARLGLEPRRTRELVAIGRKMLTLPLIDEAFCKHEIGWTKVLHLTTVAVPEHEAAWLDRARTLSTRDLALEVRLSRSGSAPRKDGNRKGLPEVRFPIHATVGALTHQKVELSKQKLSAELGRAVTDADWLDMLADLHLHLEEDGTVPGRKHVSSSLYRIVLRPGDDPAHLVLDSEDGPIPVDAGPIRCDAEVVRVADDEGPDTQGHLAPPTPPWLRTKVLTRDALRCRCCGARLGLNAHHIEFRGKHGPTKAGNLVALCERCHALLHAGLLAIEGDDVASLRFVDLQRRPVNEPLANTETLRLPCDPRPSSGLAGAAIDRRPLVLDDLPAAIDATWWKRFAHLVRMGEKGLELLAGEPLPEPTGPTGPIEAPPCTAFDATALEAAFSGLVGQKELLARWEAVARGSHARGRPFPHTLLTGPAGTGKTTLAQALAAACGRRLVKTTGPLLRDVQALVRLLADVRAGDVLFVEEVHAVPPIVLEALYEALAEGGVSLTFHQGAQARASRLVLPPFTFVAATTEDGSLPTPFLTRFGLTEHLGFYERDVLASLVVRRAREAGVALDLGAAARLADLARGTPRGALRLLERVLDQAAGAGLRRVERRFLDASLERLGYDVEGFDPRERRYLAELRRSPVPVAVARLARLLGASVRTLVRDVEPWLFRLGLVEVGPGGRTAVSRPRLRESPALG